MTTQEFIEKLKQALEFEKINIVADTNLRTINGFDSMSIMVIIAFVDEYFSKKMTARQLSSITTVTSLQELIGMEMFSD